MRLLFLLLEQRCQRLYYRWYAVCERHVGIPTCSTPQRLTTTTTTSTSLSCCPPSPLPPCSSSLPPRPPPPTARRFPSPVPLGRNLEADHAEKQLEDNALDRIRTLRCAPQTAGGTSSGDDLASAAAVVEALKAYVSSLEAHLEKEERAIVGRWLNLDAEMYAKYRTYLVGKYKLVY